VPSDTPPGNNTPHAERTADAAGGHGLAAEKHPVPEAEVRAVGWNRSPTWSCGAQIRRRPYGAAQRARRRRAPGRGLDQGPLRRRDRQRPHLRPRRSGQQVRLRHLHLRAARAGSGGPAGPGAWSCCSPTTRSSAARSARPGCCSTRSSARPDDRRRLQLPGHHRAQRLPADGGDGARQDGACGHPRLRRRRDAGRGGDPEPAVCAEHAVQERALPGGGHQPPVPERRPDRGRHQHQRRARTRAASSSTGA
jgi:hypothetical protein